MSSQAEIFRHLRPHWYDKRTHQLVPQPFGGISFLLKPTAEKQYDFWVYICPDDTAFSARQAVKSLRERATTGVVPFGTLQLNEDPLVDQLTRYVINEQMVLPSEASKQLLSITIINAYAQRKKEAAEASAKASAKVYEVK